MSNPEHKLQAECVVKFSQKYPEQYNMRRLFGYFAEGKNDKEGAMKKSLGLVRDIPDLTYIPRKGWFIGIEMKFPNTRHDRLHLVGQARCLINNYSDGYFCDNLEMFFSIINGGVGISPAKVLENCLRLKTQTVNWEEAKK